jgi:hypothetical protein
MPGRTKKSLKKTKPNNPSNTKSKPSKYIDVDADSDTEKKANQKPKKVELTLVELAQEIRKEKAQHQNGSMGLTSSTRGNLCKLSVDEKYTINKALEEIKKMGSIDQYMNKGKRAKKSGKKGRKRKMQAMTEYTTGRQVTREDVITFYNRRMQSEKNGAGKGRFGFNNIGENEDENMDEEERQEEFMLKRKKSAQMRRALEGVRKREKEEKKSQELLKEMKKAGKAERKTKLGKGRKKFTKKKGKKEVDLGEGDMELEIVDEEWKEEGSEKKSKKSKSKSKKRSKSERVRRTSAVRKTNKGARTRSSRKKKKGFKKGTKHFDIEKQRKNQKKRMDKNQKKRDKIANAIAYLQESSIPEEILCRDKEKRIIRKFLSEGIESNGNSESLCKATLNFRHIGSAWAWQDCVFDGNR